MRTDSTATDGSVLSMERRWAVGGGLALGMCVGVAVTLFFGWNSARPIDEDGARGRTTIAKIEAILRAPEGFARVEDLARSLARADAASELGVRGLLEDLHLPISKAESLLLLEYWANRDPAEAFDWARSNSPSAYRSAAIDLTIERLAAADPALVLQRIETLAQSRSLGMGGEGAKIALIRGWLASGKPGVEDYIRDLGVGFARQHLLSAYARERIRRNEIDGLERWAEALPDEPKRFKLAAFRQIGSELTIFDPALGVAWCDEHCDGPFGLSVRQLVAARWAMSDGRAALEWASRYPEDPMIHLAIRDAYRTWHRADSEAALAFVDELGFDRAVDSWFRPAVGIYAAMIAPARPVEALRWAMAEEDPERREPNVVTILRRWRETDRAAAEEWIESSTLTDEARRRARQPVQLRPQRRALRSGAAHGK